MYHHVKKLMYTVRVDEPDPRFGNMLLEQFGGANGELAAAMQYSIQGLNCEDPDRKDLLMDIRTEELSHLEIVGCLARMHLKPMRRRAREACNPRANCPFQPRRSRFHGSFWSPNRADAQHLAFCRLAFQSSLIAIKVRKFECLLAYARREGRAGLN